MKILRGTVKMVLDFQGKNIDPYQVLDLPKGCRDMKKIKRAYRSKCLNSHPDKGGNNMQFHVLKMCYLYLKALCQELERNQILTNNDLMNQLNSLQKGRSQEHSSSNQKYDSLGPLPPSGTRERIDLSRPITDSSVMANDFDVDRTYEEMMQYRPTSLRYSNADVPNRKNPFSGKKDISLQEFNQWFEEQKEIESPTEGGADGIDGFAGFDSIEGGSAVVTDGNLLFINGKLSKQEDISNQGALSNMGFSMLQQFSHYDKQLEYKRNSLVSTAEKISLNDLERYRQFYDTCTSNGDHCKLTKREFDDRMQYMSGQYQDNLEAEKMRNKNLLEQHMMNLSQGTQVKLKNHMRLH